MKTTTKRLGKEESEGRQAAALVGAVWISFQLEPDFGEGYEGVIYRL